MTVFLLAIILILLARLGSAVDELTRRPPPPIYPDWHDYPPSPSDGLSTPEWLKCYRPDLWEKYKHHWQDEREGDAS